MARDGRIVPTKARCVNYSTLIEVLTSSDPSLLKEYSWMFDGQNRFLDGSEPLNSKKHANRI